jgi:hypothetical protein
MEGFCRKHVVKSTGPYAGINKKVPGIIPDIPKSASIKSQ